MTNPMSPQQARAQVMDAGKDLVRSLGLQQDDFVKAAFQFESCTDDNKGPFRGWLSLQFWMPRAARSHPVDPEVVYAVLRQHDWHSDAEFHTHSMAMKKDGVVADLSVYAADLAPVAHVGVVLRGECRDTYDHSKDPFDGSDHSAELLS